MSKLYSLKLQKSQKGLEFCVHAGVKAFLLTVYEDEWHMKLLVKSWGWLEGHQQAWLYTEILSTQLVIPKTTLHE